MGVAATPLPLDPSASQYHWIPQSRSFPTAAREVRWIADRSIRPTVSLLRYNMEGPGLPDAPARPGNGEHVVLDAEALDRLLLQFWRPLVAYVSRLLNDTEAAEDVVQRAFVRLWERGHTVPAGDDLRPFLYRVVRNLATNEWRRRRTEQSWLEEESVLHSPTALPSRGLEEDELVAALAAAVERLPARRREVFVLSRYHALSNAQIAEILSIAPQTVANQLVSALRELRVMLGPYLDERPVPSLRIVRGTDAVAG